jgi:hypothetical protein
MRQILILVTSWLIYQVDLIMLNFISRSNSYMHDNERHKALSESQMHCNREVVWTWWNLSVYNNGPTVKSISLWNSYIYQFILIFYQTEYMIYQSDKSVPVISDRSSECLRDLMTVNIHEELLLYIINMICILHYDVEYQCAQYTMHNDTLYIHWLNLNSI